MDKTDTNKNALTATQTATPTATQTAVAVRSGCMTALQLCGNMSAVNALGQTLAQSGFFGAVSASTATAAVINCFMEGLTPMQFKAKYHIFENGQTGIRSDYYQREFQRLGGDWEFVKWDDSECDMRFSYHGRVFPLRVTIDKMKANGVALGKDGKTMKANWVKFPMEMLKARCMATAIRAICPKAMEGHYTQEEVEDFDSMQTAQAVTADAPTASATPTDCGVCPCGSVKGKAWADLPTETLEKILATPEAKAVRGGLTAEHRNAIVAELARREADEAETVDAEAEVVEG